MTILVVGDVVTDTVVRLHAPMAVGSDAPASITDTPGGQGANVARWLATTATPVRLLASVSVSDTTNHTALLAADGVTADLVMVEAPPARIVVVVDPAGSDRSFLTQRGAASQLDSDAADRVDLGGVTWCHISGYLLTSAAGRSCYARLRTRCENLGIPVSVDPASASEIVTIGPTEIRRLTSGVALLIPNEDEARVLSGLSEPASAAHALLAEAKTIVVKCGPDGAVASSRAGGPLRVPAVPTPVVDPTGAGDAFAAGLLSALVTGASLPDALETAAGLAAHAVSVVGAGPPRRAPT